MTGKKFVAVLNKKFEIGRVMNALAHCTAGLSDLLKGEDLGMISYEDKDGGMHWSSKNPFIILRAKNGNQIRSFKSELEGLGLKYATFHDRMIMKTWKEQVEAAALTPEADLDYLGIVTFGDAADLDPLTKKFSLWN